MLPVKRRSGIGLPARRDLAMASNASVSYVRPGGHNQVRHFRQPAILFRGIRRVIGSLKLNPDGKIVTFFLPLKTRTPGVPGAIQQTDELHHGAITANQQVGRHLDTGYGLEIWMGSMIKTVTEEVFYFRATELTRGKTDVVDDQKGDHSTFRTRPKVWRGTPARKRNPSGFTKCILVGTGIGKARGQNV